MKDVAQTFSELQQKRHTADYDNAYNWTKTNAESWIDNVRHPVSSRLAAARATRMTYRDHGFAWNNTGRNGHYAAFVWSGP